MSLYNPTKVFLLKLSYLFFLLLAAILTVVSFDNPQKQFAYQLGQIFGVLGLSCLSLQLFLGARVKFLEKGVGLPTIMRWHSINARLVFVFILLHPIFIFAPAIFAGGTIADIRSSFTIYHWAGILAFLLIIFTVLITIYQRKIRLNYEHWKTIHKIGYLIIILGFMHSFFVGSDIEAGKPVFYWWIALAGLATTSVLYRYGIRRWALRNSWYKIVKIIKESPDVRSIYFKPLNGKIFSYYPGQFAFVRFYTPSLSREEHHFTISSSPIRNPLSFTIKESGDFTSTLGKLKVGDKAKIEGGFGVFSNFGMAGPFVFIAGGIGITPVMGMIRFMKDSKQKEKTILIYSARSKKDLVFYKELEVLKRTASWFNIVYVLSEETGRITYKLLRKQISDLKSQKFFVVGPPAMIEEVCRILKKQGAEKQRLFTEVFALK